MSRQWMERPWVLTLQCELIHYSLFIPLSAPGDYNTVTTTLTFDEQTSRNCVNFTGFEDNVVEPNENFTVILTNGDDVILIPDIAIVTIEEGEGKRNTISPGIDGLLSTYHP